MFNSQIASRYRKEINERYYQGDIIKDLSFVMGSPLREEEKTVMQLPYAVVLSQDCDLQQDFSSSGQSNQDKSLLSVLICPAYILEHFALGTHIGSWDMRKFNSSDIDKLKGNDSYKRYHYLCGDAMLSVPDLIIDFKHFFTVPREYMYSIKNGLYVASLSELFREELSQRFANYLSRIGLPEL